MSGGIFKPIEESVEEVEETVDNRHCTQPLLCHLCHGDYEDPRILQCHHSFCAHCLRGRAVNGYMNCPLCGTSTKVDGEKNLPPSDLLLKYIIGTGSPDKTPCANCDGESRSMFFCSTCAQPLCEACRLETHQAKMFSSHDICLLSQKSWQTCPKCDKHNEPYIMFRVDLHKLLCINCFKDLNSEFRANCVDLDSAYQQGCITLENSAQSLKELQGGVQDGIWLLRGLLDELKQRSEEENIAIEDLYTSLHEHLSKKQDELIKNVLKEKVEKEREFREQLCALNTLLPTLHTHLVTCKRFSSKATKFDFLEYGYTLIERMDSIASTNLSLQPKKSGQIETNFRTEFARCIEQLLGVKLCRTTSKQTWKNEIDQPYSSRKKEKDPSSRKDSTQPNNKNAYSYSGSGGRKIHINGPTGGKIIIVEAGSSFAEHCKEFEAKHREILQRFECVKLQVQELQKDVTLRRCLAKKTKVSDINDLCSNMDDLIEEHRTSLNEQRTLLDKHWEEAYQRIANEQDVYQAQINDSLRIKKESEYMKRIVQHLATFITSINTVNQKVSPKLGEVIKSLEKGDTMNTILQQISTLEPDSELRVEAIHKSEEERQLAASNRANPLVEELIKTKEILKSPSTRRDCCSIRRGESFESAMKSKREIGIDLSSTSETKNKGGTKPVSGYDRIPTERCSSYSPTTETSDSSLLSTNEIKTETNQNDRTIKKALSLPLKGTYKRRLSKGELSQKNDGASLRELLNGEIVAWSEQREKCREKEESNILSFQGN